MRAQPVRAESEGVVSIRTNFDPTGDDGLHARIESIRIRGFRSLADVRVTELPAVAILIGANGSGKSNVMRFFEMLGWMLRSSRLADYVQMQGGADDQLFHGRRRTAQMEAELRLATQRGHNDYRFVLAYAHPDRLIFLEEAYRFSDRSWETLADWRHLGSGHAEAGIVSAARASASPQRKTASVVVNLLRNCVTYQFHDTSDESRFKQSWDITDNGFLRSHGGNLAAVLHRLEAEESDRFRLICRQVRRILPGFDRFVLDERYGKVSLRWATTQSDKTFGAHLTSDGSLRFFALVTLLNLPPEMLPDVILLDEPELGLHPMAVDLVAEMVTAVGRSRQVIVATQSPLFVDAFGLDQVIVVDLDEGATVLRQLDAAQYAHWIEQDYSPGRLWTRNLLGGGP